MFMKPNVADCDQLSEGGRQLRGGAAAPLSSLCNKNTPLGSSEFVWAALPFTFSHVAGCLSVLHVPFEDR